MTDVYRRLLSTIIYVPSKGRQLHSKHHLGSSDINDLVTGLCECTKDMVHRKIPHDAYEDDPRHIRGPDIIGY